MFFLRALIGCGELGSACQISLVRACLSRPLVPQRRFHTTVDILNEYLEEYKLPAVVRQSLRAYFHHCRYVW